MMTRDAKIGLLVGLAFILIVGILLSEHITVATAPQQASLAQAGDRVRRGTSAPVAPTPIVPDAKVNPDPQPKQAVVTREQLDSPVLPPTTRIELGAPQGGQIKVIRVDQPQDPIASAVEVPANPSSAPQTSMLAATTSQSEPITDLQRVARENGMELVNTDGTEPRQTEPRQTKPTPAVHSSKVREYVAQPGDSLSRMASRLLGANTPANQQLIISLNPSLQKDNNRILVGAKYLIPADPWASALGVESSQSSEPAAKPANATKEPTKEPTKAAAPANTVTYVVKTGDSLWKIAERECGSANAVAAIKELNPEIFAKSETVKVGQKLKLPKKSS